MKRFHEDCYAIIKRRASYYPSSQAELEGLSKTVVKARKRYDCERLLPKKCEMLGILKGDRYVLLVSEQEVSEALDAYCNHKCGHTIIDKQTFQRCMEKECRVALKVEHLDFARDMGFKEYGEDKLRMLLEAVKPDIL